MTGNKLSKVNTAWDERLLAAAEHPGQWMTLEVFDEAHKAHDAKHKVTRSKVPLRTSLPGLYELRVVPAADDLHWILQGRLHVAVDTPAVAPYHGEVTDEASEIDYVPSMAIAVGSVEAAPFQALAGEWRGKELVLVTLWPSEHQLVIPTEVLDYLLLVLQDVRNPNG
jgi:hypothetical protein